MYIKISFFTLLVFYGLSSFGQTIETNNEGEKIVRFPDGSWRYYEPADSVYLNPNKENTQVAKASEENISPELKAKIDASKEQIDKVEKEIIRLMERRVSINDKLLKVEDVKEKLDLNTELQRVIQQEKEQKRIYLDLKQELENLSVLKKMPAEKQSDALSGVDAPTVEKGKINYSKGRKIESIPDHIYDIPYVCDVQQSKDEFSNRMRTHVKNDLFFEYTPKVIRSKLNQQAFLTAYISSFHIQGRFYFNLMIDVASSRARQTYGYIAQGGQLMLQLVNGDVYTLRSTGNAIGTIMPSGELTRYDIAYAVDYKIINELKKHPLDKVRLVWSTGYEDYTIYNVDILKDQIICLESNL